MCGLLLSAKPETVKLEMFLLGDTSAVLCKLLTSELACILGTEGSGDQLPKPSFIFSFNSVCSQKPKHSMFLRAVDPKPSRKKEIEIACCCWPETYFIFGQNTAFPIPMNQFPFQPTLARNPSSAQPSPAQPSPAQPGPAQPRPRFKIRFQKKMTQTYWHPNP